MKHNGTRDPDAIIAEIERTRSDMDVTLSAIEEKLTPGQLMDQGLDYLRHNGGTEYLSNFGTAVRNNPIPAALVGIGLAWLMAADRRGPSMRYASRGTAEGLAESASDIAARASNGAAASKDRIAQAAHSARDRVADSAQRTRDRVADAAQRTRDSWHRTSAAARHQVDRARSNYDYVRQEQPLALGALGFGIGALLAASAPRTRREDELMGEASQRVKEYVSETGQEQMERARGALEATKDRAQQGSEKRADERRTAEQPGAGSRVGQPTTAASTTSPTAESTTGTIGGG